jgi:single-stranded-DNA-specific exonuclease
MNSPQKTWLLRQSQIDVSQEHIYELANDTGLPKEIIKLLVLRGFSDKQGIKDFLSPSLSQLPRPHLMKGMAEAVKILSESLESRRPITIYGDFDADGVTSTTVLFLFLSELDVPLNYFIPDRLTEGYGLNSEAVKKIYETNKQQWGEPGILITVDCGISDDEVVDGAKKLGFTVIITDHHKPPEKLPPADAILNPLQPECNFPCKNLAGVGVAFYLILGLRSELVENGHWPENNIPNLKSYMDIPAIGTVADQVQLTDCNRIIVKAGLEVLNQGNRIGLQKLLSTTKGYESEITSGDIAFRIAPRINAIGRVGSAQKAVELLSTRIPEDAEKLANELEEANKARKNIEANIFDEALQMVSSDTLKDTFSLLLYKSDWHQGVLGIVASRLTDKYNRPAILLTDCSPEDSPEMEKLAKGSGRSIEGVDIHHAVSSCQEILERFGGHKGAVGLTLVKENIDSFRQQFDRIIGEQLENTIQPPSLMIDIETTLEVLSDKNFISAYSLLAPYGSGNPKPVFCLTGQKLTNPRLVGNNHLRFTIMEKGNSMNGIGFGFGEYIHEAQNSLMDVAFVLKLNSYMGQAKWEIHLTALRPTNIDIVSS